MLANLCQGRYNVDHLITNRTYDDVKRWKTLRDKGWLRMTEEERKEWFGEIETTPAATKGMYTHNDLNRVEKAVETISLRFKDAGYKVPELKIKTDWTYQDTITKSDMERYLYNVLFLREFLITFSDTPNAPSIDVPLNYKLANDIEKILKDIYKIADGIVRSRYYAGEIMSGEV